MRHTFLESPIEAQQVDATGAQELDKQLQLLSAELSKLHPDRTAAANSALTAAPLAQNFSEKLATMPDDQTLTLHTLQHIADDAEGIALADERAAEQAAMAADSLYIVYSKNAKPANDAEIRVAINTLFQQLENPSAYDANQFAASLRRLRPLLPWGKIRAVTDTVPLQQIPYTVFPKENTSSTRLTDRSLPVYTL